MVLVRVPVRNLYCHDAAEVQILYLHTARHLNVRLWRNLIGFINISVIRMCSRDLLIALWSAGQKLQLPAQVKETIRGLGLHCLRRGPWAGEHTRQRPGRCTVIDTATETATTGKFPDAATHSTVAGHIPVIVDLRQSTTSTSRVKSDGVRVPKMFWYRQLTLHGMT